ncbi:MAG: serine--tRNA ligase [Alphaproteobacteria bacterium]|nr:serine--tRNA ligase [Alphaproteobacteria bacterium]
MHDIKAIRDDPAGFDAGLARRGLPSVSAELMTRDQSRRDAQLRRDQLLARRNAASKEIGQAKAQKREDDAQRLMSEVAQLKDELAATEAREAEAARALDAELAAIPNIPAAHVPDGRDETGNRELRRWGTPRKFDFKPREHFANGEALGLMDFERAGRISGARFAILKGALARLERALGQFMLDIHTGEFGYTEVSPPMLVRSNATYGVGQLPKFAEDLFRTTNDYWLIPTAEVPLTNLAADEITDEATLPHRYTAHTACFRSEAGSAGKDTRGMLRQHQFYKVELVSITTPEQSNDEHERMTRAAETVLQRLELPYRVMHLCTGDMGFASRSTYDIEVWLPGQDTYREISSCSNCGDFQARRMSARCRKPGEKGTRFVHTLNGSGIAVGRALIAVLENNQSANGQVTIPAALRPYMGGLEMIG